MGQAKEFIFDVRWMPVSFIIGFLLMPLHEFLHAIWYPKGAEVYVGVCLLTFTLFPSCGSRGSRKSTPWVDGNCKDRDKNMKEHET